jgi:phosphate acetyltransferase
MATRPHFQRLVEKVRMRPPLPAAIACPCDRDSLQLALSGAFAGYLAPVLVGPEGRIRDAAAKAGLDISRLPVVDTADDPRAAGERAAGLARNGKVAALVKGAMADGDLLAPVAAADSGLRGAHRLSHACFLDLPGRPGPLLLADAHLNVAPNLAAKKDIVANTVALARALGIASPSVALVAATDYVTPALVSTGDAAALKAMATQGMFGTVTMDGPLGADSALSADAARANGVRSEVAGRAEVLVAPAMEAASMVLRTLTALTGGLAAGIVLGAKVPIVAPSRGDSMEVRMASCVLASLVAAAQAEGPPVRSHTPTPESVRAVA